MMKTNRYVLMEILMILTDLIAFLFSSALKLYPKSRILSRNIWKSDGGFRFSMIVTVIGVRLSALKHRILFASDVIRHPKAVTHLDYRVPRADMRNKKGGSRTALTNLEARGSRFEHRALCIGKGMTRNTAMRKEMLVAFPNP